MLKPALLALLLLPATAFAESYGDAGVISPAGFVSFGYASYSQPQGGSSSITTFALVPQVLYFVIDDVAVGGSLSFSSSNSSGNGFGNSNSHGFGITPMGAYNLRLSDLMSLQLQGGLQYSTSTTDAGRFSTTSSGFSLLLSTPLLFHFGNFFLGGGPQLDVDITSTQTSRGISSDGPKRTAFSINSVIGGWF